MVYCLEKLFMSNTLSFCFLNSSGSTGRPKGLLHTTGGYALYAMHTTSTSFGISQQTGPSVGNDPVYACVADAGK